MKLIDSKKRHWTRIAAKTFWQYRSYRYLGALLYTIVIFAFGAYVYKTGFFHRTIKPLVMQNISLVPKAVSGMLSKPEQITIDIKHKNFMKLAYKRQVALANKILVSSSEDFVPAAIRYKDKSIDVKLRLKGDWVVHFDGDKWSFRVRVKGENTLFGMKQFSLQHPKTRLYLHGWLYHRALKRENVLSFRFDFIKVILNGKDMGIYALEEHFEKRLIEHNRLREGPIVRFNEDLSWAELIQQGRLNFMDRTQISGSYLSSDIDAFQTRKWLSDSASYLQYTKAIHLLESFRRGELKTSKVFDVNKLAKYFAISELMGARHGTGWRNARFYYNPITSRLEPIGFDAFGNEPRMIKFLVPILPQNYSPGKDNVYYYNYKYYEMLFNDKIFYQEYIKQLERISASSYLKNLFADVNKEVEKNLGIIYKEFPYYHFSKDVMVKNQRFIRTALNPVKGLHAYIHTSARSHIEFELGNIQYLPIEVLSVSYKDSLLLQPIGGATLLPGKDPSQPVDYQNACFTFPEDFVWSDTLISELKVNYKILGTSQIRNETVFPWTYLDENFIDNDFIRQKSNVEKFDFLITDESAKKIVIKPGIWNIDQNLIIPKEYSVICSEGTQLNLSNSAKILSYSPLEFIGSEDYPIIIQSTESTGQGIVVMNAIQTSVLDYVIFNNLSNPSQSGWELTGAVTFYESPVAVSHCQFIGNRSEDALNIVRSEFTVDRVFLKRTFSDALDADFSKGEITNSSFVACGNDAVDVSGSVIELRNVFINGAGDKGLNVGENSHMTVNHIDIKNAAIAVASKDMSDITLKNVNMSDGEIGFTAYQNKSEFGSASIKVMGLEIARIDIPYLTEDRSTVVVDGVVIGSSRKNVKAILYGVEYGKSSK